MSHTTHCHFDSNAVTDTTTNLSADVDLKYLYVDRDFVTPTDVELLGVSCHDGYAAASANWLVGLKSC